MQHLKYKIFFYIIAALLPAAVLASNTNGTIDSDYKYAWSENYGWINFSASNGNVSVTDSAITGYAWSEHYGWINLSPSISGIANDGYGDLSGHAWAENLGWIDFSGVSIDTSGYFSGYAVVDQDSSQISFNCSNTSSCASSDFKVRTDWRPRSVRPACNNSLDDDGDNKIDYPDDPGCSSLTDDDETDPGSVPLWILNPPSETASPAEEDEDIKEEIQEDEEKTIDGRQQTADSSPADAPPDAEALEDKEAAADKQKVEEESKESLADKAVEKMREILESMKDKVIASPKALSSKLLPIADEFFKPEYFKIDFKKIALSKLTPEKLFAVIPDFLKPKSLKIDTPRLSLEKLVPKIAPFSLTSRWRLMPEKPIKIFVFAPLPDYLSNLAKKFPELNKTFSEVGINKMADISKLQGAKFTLQGISGDSGLKKVKIGSEDFYLPAGIPIAGLSAELKQKIPSEIIFAKAGGELIDFGIDLTVDKKGVTQQKITTIAGKMIKLVVKPDGPVDAVRGYLVFKGKHDSLSLRGVNEAKRNERRSNPADYELPVFHGIASSFHSLRFAPFLAMTNGLFAKSALAKEEAESASFKLQDFLYSLIFAKPTFAYQQEQPVKAEEKLVLMEFDYNDSDNDGIWTAEIQAPVVNGEYEVITVIYYTDPELGTRAIRLTTVVDPEGYIYEEYKGKEIRIPGAIASLYWLNPGIKQYQLWPAEEYNQENQQITGMSGNYSFLVPEGSYYLKVEAPGYLVYQGKPFQVREGSGVHMNIELKSKYWWIKLINWQTIILIIVVLLLFYNFYRDKMRGREERTQH